jgi:hypothetical protein
MTTDLILSDPWMPNMDGAGNQELATIGRGETGPRAPRVALPPELNPNTDPAGLVERVAQDKLSRVVVPAAALTAWEERDPAGWAKVSA